MTVLIPTHVSVFFTFSISVRIQNIMGLEKYFRTHGTPIQNILGQILIKQTYLKKAAFFATYSRNLISAILPENK